MKTILQITTVVAFAATAFAADPIVSGEPTVSQGRDRKVRVSYTLAGAPAIVTFEVFTNGVSIGGRPLWASWGDVNAIVQPGSRTIFWQPREWSDRFVVDSSVSVKVTARALDNPPDYLCIDLSIPSNRVWYANAEAVPFGVTNNLYKTAKLLMRRIHAAGIRWRKGSSQGQETGHWATEVAYPVILTKDYYIGVFPVTYRQHSLFENPASTTTTSQYYPQQGVSTAVLRGALPTYDWQANGSAVDPSLRIGKLRDFTGIDTFDLPSDAQWEFACLGGTAHPRFGVTTADLPKYAWYDGSNFSKYGGNGNRAVQHVGLLLPNPYGLYDMLGLGFELCTDWYVEGDTYAKEGELQIDPRGPANDGNNKHVLHAAAWVYDADHQRSCARSPGQTYTHDSSGSYGIYRLVCGIDMR